MKKLYNNDNYIHKHEINFNYDVQTWYIHNMTCM